MYSRRQQDCTPQVSILGNSRQDIEDAWSKYECSKVDLKASGAEAFRLYEPNLLAFVLNKFDFWGPKCPNYENIEF